LDVAPFNIRVTIVEPGGARMQSAFSSAALGPKMDAYSESPARHARRVIEEATRVPPGDPARLTKAMIDSVDQNPAGTLRCRRLLEVSPDGCLPHLSTRVWLRRSPHTRPLLRSASGEG
jgi:hypothetical protein